MKFLVSDSQDERHTLIRSYLTPEKAVIAAILAAVDLEWTIRRVLDHAAASDAKSVDPRHVSGLHQYDDAWKQAFKGPFVSSLREIVDDWDSLRTAYQLRNDLVHGRQGTSGLSHVTKRVGCILKASEAVAAFGRQHAADPYKRLRKRGGHTGPTPRKDKSKKRRKNE